MGGGGGGGGGDFFKRFFRSHVILNYTPAMRSRIWSTLTHVRTIYIRKKAMVISISKGKRHVLVDHCRKLGTPTANETVDANFEKEGDQRVGRGERRCARKGRSWFRRVAERVHKKSKK